MIAEFRNWLKYIKFCEVNSVKKCDNTKILNLNSDKSIPNYLLVMADSKIETVRRLQNDKTMSFAFITDLHTTVNSNYSDIEILNYISAQTDIEFIANSGDSLDNVADKQIHLNVASKLISKLKDKHDFMLVKGNHDDNSIQQEGVNNVQFTMLPQEQYARMFKHLEEKVVFDETNKFGMYYYYDVPKYKVRAIFLNNIDIPYIYGDSTQKFWKYAGQHTYNYSNAQLNWLAEKALNFSDKQDKIGWKVVLFAHINPFQEGMIGNDLPINNGDIALNIIDAYKNGTAYISTPTTGDFAQSVTVDFSSQGKGDVIAFFYGHTHYAQNLIRNEINYITSWNGICRKDFEDEPARTPGTASEINLEVVTINFDQRKLFVTNFGAGNDRVIQY